MVILLSGSINSGKTTIAKQLCAELYNCAHIEVDLLREFIGQVDLQLAIPIVIENTILVAQNLLRHNFNVIISYVLPKNRLITIVEALKDLDPEIYLFTLNPRIEIVLSGPNRKKLSKWEKERVKHHYEIGINRPDIGIIIDSSEQSIKETVTEILANINAKNKLNLELLEK